ncbi:MAG TPA: hydroxymethylbilane synthase [Tepidisphaeraceae bacterium]|jgi:hydroxymethylbilane synthase|nr:hydroxymethylbilane synthase [Tepidisphaeraceae bacterium]
MADERTNLTLRLGTRGSLLAQAQSRLIAAELVHVHPGLKIEPVICKTTGDKIQDRPLHDAGGKGLFTKEIEEALLAGTVDFAVHSFKDVPVTMPLVDSSKLTIAAVPRREDPRDCLVSLQGKSIQELARGAKVGTSSLRRRCQLLNLRPDLNIQMIRGNIDTRVRKLRDGEFDAVILAVAGLKRGGIFDSTFMHLIPFEQMLPAAAQGALAIQCRDDDERVKAILSSLNDPETHECVLIERALVQALDGDCHSPIAVLATQTSGRFSLHASIGTRGGELPVIQAEANSSFAERGAALESVKQSLLKQGARELLKDNKTTDKHG